MGVVANGSHTCLRRAHFARAVVLAALVTLLVTSGCSTTKGRDRLSLAELDEGRREGVEAFQEGGARWARTVEAAAGDERLARFLAENLAVELVRRYESGALSRTGAQLSPYERVRRAIGQLGEPAAELLASMVAEGDDVVAGVGADALAPLGGVALEHALVLAVDSRFHVRRRAFELIGALAPLSGEDEERVVDAMRRAVEKESSAFVRAEAVRAASRRAVPRALTDRYVSMLLLALADPEPSVVARAADGLAYFGDPRAVPGLIEALDRSTGELAAFDRIQRALRTLLSESKSLTAAQWWQLWTERRAALLAPLRNR